MPLQSLSIPSPQISVCGGVSPVQVTSQVPFTQVWMPAVQAPTSVPQGRELPSVQLHPSSTTPLQSLSTPSQISVAGCGAVQLPHAPPAQVSIPVPQRVEQGRARFSSIFPSQLLSRPSQISLGAGPQVPQALVTPSSICPLQLLSIPSQTSFRAGGAVQLTQAPAEQVSVPVPQAVEQGCASPSSIEPLQLLSIPSQISGG